MKYYCFLLIISVLPGSVFASPQDKPAANVTPDSILSVELKGEHLLKTIVSEAVAEVDARIEARESKRWTYIGAGVTALIAIIGFFGIRDVRRRVSMDVRDELRTGTMLRGLIEESVKENVTEDIEAQLKKIGDEFYFYQFSNLASSLKYGGRSGFTNKERDAAMQAIRQLSVREDIIKRDEFAVALETIIDKFAAADLNYQLDEIDDLIPNVISDVSGIIQTYMMHYGMRVLGDIDVTDDLIRRFKRFTENCKRQRIYELAIPYLMVYEYSNESENTQDILDAYIQDAANLKDEEKDTIKSLFEKNIDPSAVANRPTGQVLRFCKKYKAFYDSYKERLDNEVFA